ncbi:MAG: polysaccharide deacetylase family protein [Patescibacteria group bacterium]|nr:polysaccharide deacetylase family protein [Patescibacteria group bacterium]
MATVITSAIFVINVNKTLAAGVNLIANPGFEEAEATDPTRPANWHESSWGSVQANFIYPAPGISNTSAASVTVNSTEGTGDAKWYFDDIPVDADQTYVFGTHYRADVATEIDARYLLSDGTYSYAFIASVPASADWSTVTYTFTVPSNVVSVTIFHVISSPGTLTVDDVSLELDVVSPPPPPPPPDPTSLISNHNLETANTGFPSGWSQGGWGTNTANYVYPVAGQNGGSAIRVELSSWSSGDVKWSHPAVGITGGNTYYFSDDYRSNVSSNITLQYKLDNGSYAYAWLVDLPANTNWTKTATYNFTAPANAVEVTAFHLINGVGFLETDNYILTGEAEPPPPPPPLDPNNMITNGNLDTASASGPSNPEGWGGDSWGTLSADFVYPVADASGGTAAARVEINSYSSGDAKWSHTPVAISPNTTYSFFVDYRSNVDTEITLQYKLTDGSYSYAWLNSPPASANWASVNYSFITPANAVEVTVFHLISLVGWLETDNYKMIKQDSLRFSEAMVTLVFDDGTTSIYDNAIPIVDTAGIKTTQAIVSGYVTYDGYMNVGQIMDMQNNGHEIASHSRSHAHLTQLNETQLQGEIVGSKDDLVAMGFGPITTFVYPYGEYNNTVTRFVKDSGYYIGARSVEEGFNYTNTDPYLLMTQHVGVNTTVQELKDAIDLAIANKSWVTFMFHDVTYGGNEYSTTPEALQAFVDYIKSTGINTVTLNEGLQILNN